MKEKYYFIIVYTLIIIVLAISLYNVFCPKQTLFGIQYKSLYDPLEYNIGIIKTNMNEITISNDNWDWWKLKATNLEDKQLKNTYNLLVTDIRTCYLLSNDLKNKTYDNIKILSFKNKRSISKKELLQLNKNENCLKSFNKYNSLVLSNDQDLSKKIKKQISIIIDYKTDSSTNKTFVDLLSEESITISKIASLSSWLKVEYYSHQNE